MMGKRNTWLGLLAVCCFGRGLAADAGQAGKPAPAPSSRGGEEMILFQELPSVFGASKYEQKPSEAPASVTIITADEIQRYGYRTLSDILKSVRGFFTTYDRNYTYIGVRGFDRPGDYDTRVLLLLDGHRLNDNVYDQAAIGTEAFVDVEDIDRVEVIRGPASSLYGTNAFLAVINVVSRTGRSLKGRETLAEGASYTTGKGRLAWGGKVEDGPEVYLSGSFYGSGGQNLFYPEFNDPATNNGWAEKVDDDRAYHTFGRATFGNVSFEGGYSSRTKYIPTASFGTTFDDPRSRTTDERGFATMRYEREVSDHNRVNGALSYDGYWYRGVYPYAPTVTRDYGYGQWWTAEIQVMNTSSERHKLIYGAENRLNVQQDQGYYQVEPYALYLDDRRTANVWAVYAQDEFRIRDHVLLNAGLRHDDYTTFGGTTNPRLALILGSGEATNVKILYGTAFRAPNAYELYYNDGGFSQESNPDLSAETIRTYEVEAEHTFAGGIRGLVSFYRYGIRDLITLEPDPANPGLSRFENVDRVRSDGVEVEVEGRLGRRLEGRVSYAYQDSENQDTGAALTDSPRHLAKLNLGVPLYRDRLNLGLEVQSMSPRRLVAGGSTGGFTITNLTLLSRNWRRGPALSLSVYNLFDARYGDPGSEEHSELVIPQDGRNFRLQIRYDF
jgi:outer membrane receptor for ferrienterochelin and colicins